MSYENDDAIDLNENPVYNVIRAFINYDKETGYTQGMAMIIAMLHKNLKNEEDAFYCFIYIMEKLHWK
jgi:hypothetical protein